MQVIEILAESKRVNEAPASLIGQGLRRIGSAALSAIGAKHTAGKLAGQADVGKRANQYAQELSRYLAQIGKSLKNADYSDLNNFFKNNSIPSSGLPASGPVAKADIDKALMTAAQQSFKGGSTGAAAPSGATKAASAASAGSSAGSAADQNQPGQPASTTPAAGQEPSSAAEPAADNTAIKTPAGTITMKSIKASIAKLPKNQQASLRKIAAAKAGVQ